MCVGVFPSICGDAGCRSLPHVRGGVSKTGLALNSDHVFPTCVGVFPSIACSWPRLASSPCAWGCFLLIAVVVIGYLVFPTCVGVFPRYASAEHHVRCLPHVRGGVSYCSAMRRAMAHHVSSPCAWGCFPSTLRLYVDGVFPMCVGVFPPVSSRRVWRVFPMCVGVFPVRAISYPGLPHVRGGVPSRGHNVRPVFPMCVGVFPCVKEL